MRELIQFRSDFMACIRQFFARRGVLEVDTNLISEFGVTDVALVNVPCAEDAYLITSPEYAMKKLLSQGSGDIYQLSHVFRGDEHGRKHRREFSLLEWYRVGWDHHQLMQEVVELVQTLWPDARALPILYSSYRTLFRQTFAEDILAFDLTQLRAFTADKIAEADQWELDRDGCLDLLFTHFIESHLGEHSLEFVLDYPPSQAALAKIVASLDEVGQKEDVAARFELYINGLELCNGFWELTDANAQRQRFEQDNRMREKLDLPVMEIDAAFLQALEGGMPMAAGVALGIERLMMIVKNVNDIQLVRLD